MLHIGDILFFKHSQNCLSEKYLLEEYLKTSDSRKLVIVKYDFFLSPQNLVHAKINPLKVKDKLFDK